MPEKRVLLARALTGRGLALGHVLVDGSIDDLSVPNTVAVDQSYFDRLGVDGVGAIAEIRGQKVQVAAVSRGIRSFTTTPYVFTPLDRARAYTGTAPNKATYFLARVAPGTDVESVRSRMRANLTDVEILTQAEFRERSRAFWLFDTGAGFALFAGAILAKVHSGQQASQRVGAEVGQWTGFRRKDGERLLAHEVAHTVQQAGSASAGTQCKLAVSTPQRNASFPNVPTATEGAVPGYDFAVCAADTPPLRTSAGFSVETPFGAMKRKP